jgi:SAM-dependent methyltransferase
MAVAAKSMTVVDTAALEIFQNQWDVYRKFLQHDYLSNAEACRVLNGFLTREVARPFKFLDLACGDASGIASAIGTAPVESYRGVDLSSPALALAARNLTVLSCPVVLDEADFTTALDAQPESADVVWISLSLHHLDTAAKGAFMRAVRSAIADDGAFLIYEPTLRNGENRSEYLARFEEIGRRDWTQLTPSEFAEALKHVRTCDLPERVSDWESLGRASGFSEVREMYQSPTDLFRVFHYKP